METITISIAIGLIMAIATSAWKLSQYIRRVEKEISNDTHHHLLRIEEKIDHIKDDMSDVKQRLAKLE